MGADGWKLFRGKLCVLEDVCFFFVLFSIAPVTFSSPFLAEWCNEVLLLRVHINVWKRSRAVNRGALMFCLTAMFHCWVETLISVLLIPSCQTQSGHHGHKQRWRKRGWWGANAFPVHPGAAWQQLPVSWRGAPWLQPGGKLSSHQGLTVFKSIACRLSVSFGTLGCL